MHRYVWLLCSTHLLTSFTILLPAQHRYRQLSDVSLNKDIRTRKISVCIFTSCLTPGRKHFELYGRKSPTNTVSVAAVSAQFTYT